MGRLTEMFHLITTEKLPTPHERDTKLSRVDFTDDLRKARREHLKQLRIENQ